jgi:hypothetical protein
MSQFMTSVVMLNVVAPFVHLLYFDISKKDLFFFGTSLHFESIFNGSDGGDIKRFFFAK